MAGVRDTPLPLVHVCWCDRAARAAPDWPRGCAVDATRSLADVRATFLLSTSERSNSLLWEPVFVMRAGVRLAQLERGLPAQQVHSTKCCECFLSVWPLVWRAVIVRAARCTDAATAGLTVSTSDLLSRAELRPRGTRVHSASDEPALRSAPPGQLWSDSMLQGGVVVDQA